jgi:hypothetical protein
MKASESSGSHSQSQENAVPGQADVIACSCVCIDLLLPIPQSPECVDCEFEAMRCPVNIIGRDG